MQAASVKTLIIHQEYVPEPEAGCEFCASDHKPLVLSYLTERTASGEQYFTLVAHPSCFLGFLKTEYPTWMWVVERE